VGITRVELEKAPKQKARKERRILVLDRAKIARVAEA